MKHLLIITAILAFAGCHDARKYQQDSYSVGEEKLQFANRSTAYYAIDENKQRAIDAASEDVAGDGILVKISEEKVDVHCEHSGQVHGWKIVATGYTHIGKPSRIYVGKQQRKVGRLPMVDGKWIYKPQPSDWDDID